MLHPVRYKEKFEEADLISKSSIEKNSCSLPVFVSLFLWQLVCYETHSKNKVHGKGQWIAQNSCQKKSLAICMKQDIFQRYSFLWLGKQRKKKANNTSAYSFFFALQNMTRVSQN